jgi:hypothetical protein
MTESEFIDRALTVLKASGLPFGKVQRVVFLPQLIVDGVETYPDDAWSVVVKRPTPPDCVTFDPSEYVVYINVRTGEASLQQTM